MPATPRPPPWLLTVAPQTGTHGGTQRSVFVSWFVRGRALQADASPPGPRRGLPRGLVCVPPELPLAPPRLPTLTWKVPPTDFWEAGAAHSLTRAANLSPWAGLGALKFC